MFHPQKKFLKVKVEGSYVNEKKHETNSKE